MRVGYMGDVESCARVYVTQGGHVRQFVIIQDFQELKLPYYQDRTLGGPSPGRAVFMVRVTTNSLQY